MSQRSNTGLTSKGEAPRLHEMVWVPGGAFQIVFGLLTLGQLTFLVSYSVMTGLLAGLAMLLTLSQLPTAAGDAPSGGNKLNQALDLLLHIAEINVLFLALTVLTPILAIILSRTRLGHFASIVAIAIPSLLALFFDARAWRSC